MHSADYSSSAVPPVVPQRETEPLLSDNRQPPTEVRIDIAGGTAGNERLPHGAGGDPRAAYARGGVLAPPHLPRTMPGAPRAAPGGPVPFDSAPPPTESTLMRDMFPGLRCKMACSILFISILVCNLILWWQPPATFERIFERAAIHGVRMGGWEVYRLLTAVVVYYGFKDLGISAFTCLQVSAQIEQKFGAFRWLLLYLSSGLMAGLAGAAASPDRLLSTGAAAGLGAAGFQFGEILLILPQLMFCSRQYKIAALLAFMVSVAQFLINVFFVSHNSWVTSAVGFCTGIHFGVTWNRKIQFNTTLAWALRIVTTLFLLTTFALGVCRVFIYGFPDYVTTATASPLDDLAWPGMSNPRG